jgi:aryl-phospho-beta-D-glucosidase BglC (GH1 family)
VWGNPKTTQRLIDSVKAAGFNSIRIPVAWSKFSDETTYTIDTTWMARVFLTGQPENRLIPVLLMQLLIQAM